MSDRIEQSQAEAPQLALHCWKCGQLIGWPIMAHGVLKLICGFSIRWPLNIKCVCGQNVRWKGEDGKLIASAPAQNPA